VTTISPFPMTFRKHASRTLLLGLLAVCLCVRIGHWSSGRPRAYPDSAEYMAVALSIETWDFHSYTGERTPVYPLFLLLCGLDTQRVWILQSIMGVMISFLLFRIVLLLTHDPIMGFLAGLAHSLSLNVLFFEAAILAETVSTFCLILCLFLLLRNLNGAKESWISYALMGFTVGLGALVKPLLLYLPFLIACILLFHWRIRRRPLRRVAVYLSAFLFPSFILLGGWSIFNKAAVDYFGTTTLLGYNLMQHTGQMIDDAPQEDATIREIFIRYRNNRMDLTGSATFTVFDARQEMMLATHTSGAGLSKILTGVALRLIAGHPIVYARSVFGSWKSFWSVPMSEVPYGIFPGKVGRILETLWTGEKEIIFGLRLAFLIIVMVRAVLILRVRLAPKRSDITLASWFLAAVVLMGSIVQACFESGENARYSLPFQSLMIAYVVIAVAPYFPGARFADEERRNESTPGQL